MNKSISIQEWHMQAKNGAAPPVRILLNGGSMYPLVRMNCDYVTIVPLQEKPVPGDIVLFFNDITKRFVVHRVWEVENGKVMTWGDNCSASDGWFEMDSILGKIILIERGKRKIHPNPQKGMKWAKIWHKIKPSYYFCWRIKQGIARRIKIKKV